MANITQSTQLNLFTTIVNAIRSDTVLSKRFKTKDFYEFEPNFKSREVSLPLFVINIPNTSDDEKVVNNATVMKSFTTTILLKMDYSARDNARNYCNRVITALEDNESSFTSLFYYDLSIELDDVVEEIEEQKQIIVATFTLGLRGAVSK